MSTKIDGSLKSLIVPGFTGYTTPLGTELPQGTSLTPRQVHENMMLPYTSGRVKRYISVPTDHTYEIDKPERDLTVIISDGLTTAVNVTITGSSSTSIKPELGVLLTIIRSAATATAHTTATTTVTFGTSSISLVGDVLRFALFSDTLIPLRETQLTQTGVTAGTYGATSSNPVTPSFGDTFVVPGFTVNTYGQLTEAGWHTVKVPTITNNKLPDTGVTAGTYGTTAATQLTPAFGGTFSVPGFTVSAKGVISTAGAHNVKLPTIANSDLPNSGVTAATYGAESTSVPPKGMFKIGRLQVNSKGVVISGSSSNITIEPSIRLVTMSGTTSGQGGVLDNANFTLSVNVIVIAIFSTALVNGTASITYGQTGYSLYYRGSTSFSIPAGSYVPLILGSDSKLHVIGDFPYISGTDLTL